MSSKWNTNYKINDLKETKSKSKSRIKYFQVKDKNLKHLSAKKAYMNPIPGM